MQLDFPSPRGLNDEVVAAVSVLLLKVNQLDSLYTISSFPFTFPNAEAQNEIGNVLLRPTFHQNHECLF